MESPRNAMSHFTSLDAAINGSAIVLYGLIPAGVAAVGGGAAHEGQSELPEGIEPLPVDTAEGVVVVF